MVTSPPIGLLAEFTHRCPMQCGYCSNPLGLQKKSAELDTQTWLDVFAQAAEMGVLQVHLSGGEPTVRTDLEELVTCLASHDIYANLITTGVLLDRERLNRLAAAGLKHVQLSFQGVNEDNAARVSNYRGGFGKKLELAAWVRELDMALTINAPIHRQNIGHVADYIALALALDAQRIEIAHVQYHGWALQNRAALLPTHEQVLEVSKLIDSERKRLNGILLIDCVTPDYYAKYPKACMGGWGREIFNITPDGRVLPCHAAETIPSLHFERVTDRPLNDIWQNSSAFQRFRGTAWLPEPCASCERKEIDFGGCRCQAMALLGDETATDPACIHSPHHLAMRKAAVSESHSPSPSFQFRRIGEF